MTDTQSLLGEYENGHDPDENPREECWCYEKDLPCFSHYQMEEDGDE